MGDEAKAGAARSGIQTQGEAVSYAHVSLESLLLVVMRHWLFVGSVALLMAILAGAASWLVTPAYRVVTVLMPVGNESGAESALSGQLGGLAALAGVSLGGGSNVESNIQYLKSHDFTTSFIEQRGLLPELFAEDYDASNSRWMAGKERTLRDGERRFRSKVMSIDVESKSKLITITFVWSDPAHLAQWCNDLVAMANERLRQKAQHNAEVNLAFLRSELASTNVVALNQALSRLIESETREAMLARGRAEYAFKIIDPAVTPDRFDRVRPRRSVMVVFGGIFGGLVAVVVVLLRVRRRAWADGN